MKLFEPHPLSPRQTERLQTIRAKGRKHYIFYRGILAYGMPVFLLTTLWAWYDDYGWHIPRQRGNLYAHVLVRLIIWSAAGYIWGARMWRELPKEPARKT
jgi:hypothetical protein